MPRLYYQTGILTPKRRPQFFAPKSFRDFTSELNAAKGGPWHVRDFDAQVEFYFRDMQTFYKGAADADFQALQAQEEPYVSARGAEISIGWVETYVVDGKVVNLDDAGKPTFPPFAEMSKAP